MKKVGILISFVLITLLATPAYAGFFDDGRDYMASDQWQEITAFDPNDRMSIIDFGTRLEYRASSVSGEEPFRAYASKWYFNLDQDFTTRVRYFYAHAGTEENDTGGLDLIAYNFDSFNSTIQSGLPPQHFSVSAENAMWDINGTLYNKYRYYAGANTDSSTPDAEVEASWRRGTSQGFLEIQYDQSEDELWMAASEYDSMSNVYLPVGSFEYDNISDLGIEKMGIVLGGRSDGAVLSSSEAYFSDFSVETGDPVVTPEPLSSILFLIGGAGFVTKKILS